VGGLARLSSIKSPFEKGDVASAMGDFLKLPYSAILS